MARPARWSIDDDVEDVLLAAEPDRRAWHIVAFDAGRQQYACTFGRDIEIAIVAVRRIGIGGHRRVPRGARAALDGHALRRPAKCVDALVVVDEPHLLVVTIDEFLKQCATDRSDPVVLEVLCSRYADRLLAFLCDLIAIRHLGDVVLVDRIVVESVVAFDIGDELMFRAGAQRTDRVHVVVDGPVLSQEMPRAERVRMPTEPVGAHACAEKRRGFNQRDVPTAHLHELMRRRASGDTTTDYQSRFHPSGPVPMKSTRCKSANCVDTIHAGIGERPDRVNRADRLVRVS